jgi:hypothetical protein
MAKSMRLFYSYSHKDEQLRQKLETHLTLLKRQNFIEQWHDREISAGDEFDRSISENLEKADIVLLLISADFLGSDYCYEIELKRAMERHEAREARVIPVILRSCDWRHAPFGKLKALPRDGKPICGSDWHSEDEAFTDVAEGIRKVVEEHPRRERPRSRPKAGSRELE